MNGFGCSRRRFLKSLAAAGIATYAAPSTARGLVASKRKPNIVFLMVDDMGWMDSSLYGSTFYETPNLERLASRGIMFTEAYAANPVCSPTRASILAGQYPARLKMTHARCHLPFVDLDPRLPARAPEKYKAIEPQVTSRLPNECYTIAEALRDGGYATGFVGKWHLGDKPFLPDNQGFDINVGGGLSAGPGSYFSPFGVQYLSDGPKDQHLTDRLTNGAIGFIKACKDSPFFLNLWYYSVHYPWEAKPELIEKYKAKVDPDNPQQYPVMGAMLETMDASVGRIIDTLDELGIAENTIIIFYSDNGGVDYMPRGDGVYVTSNRPLRGGKLSVYEGGTRVPLVVAWPGITKPGSTSAEIVSSIDFYPTLLEIAGVKPKPGLILDGVSMVPALEGADSLSREAIFCDFPHYVRETKTRPATYVRKGDWKLIRFFADGPDQEDRFELYNLKDDIGETNDLSAKHPDKVKELDILITEHLKDTGALVPTPNPDYREQRIAGWYETNHVELSHQDQILSVKSTGGSPALTTYDVGPGITGRCAVKIRMRSDSSGEGRVYWGTNRNNLFQPERMTAFSVTHDSMWRTYQVGIHIDPRLTLFGLRIEPSQASGKIEIDWISIQKSDGKEVKRWDF